MTILFFTRLFLPHIGGVETHVREVGERLASMGHKIVVVTEEINDPSLKNQQSKRGSAKMGGEMRGFDIYRMPLSASDRLKKFQIWYWLLKNRHLIVEADVVHCHDVFFWFLPFKILYPKKPVFTTFHGYETKFPPAKSAITIRSISEAMSWGNICVGDYIKKWYGTRPDVVTYGGVTLSSEKLKEVQKEERAKIVFIGRLEKDTGILVYDSAIGMLNKKSTQINFMVLGKGSLEQKITYSKAKLVNEHNIYSSISDAQIVYSSSYLSILQALMMKKPVIAYYSNPLKEDYLRLTPFAKWIQIESSAKAIADKTQDILNNPSKYEKNTNDAYAWVKTQTWDKVTKLYLDLWKKKAPGLKL